MSDERIWDRPARPTVIARDGELALDMPLVLAPARLPNRRTIPPRQWLYGTQLVRGFVTVLVAPGGTGKSLYAMTLAMSCAIGKSLLGEHLFSQCNAAVLNLEDPLEELERRTAAAMMRHGVEDEEVRGRLFIHSGDTRGIVMAAVGDDGFTILHPDEAQLIAEIKAHTLGLVVVDPFAESHELEENSNPQMVKAAAAWRRVARATGCAIILVHHVRKGVAVDIDAARGAKALTDSARIGLLMTPMSAEDAGELGILPDEKGRYVRLDSAKANLAPRPAKARWFRLEQVALENGTETYPNGDNVAAIVAWNAPSVWEKLSTPQANAALDEIAKGPREGVLYAPTRRGRDCERWAGNVLVRLFTFNQHEAAQVIKAWIGNGVLLVEDYRDPEQRRDRVCVRVVEAKRPS